MAATLSTLIDRTRRELRDWPDNDSVTASVASNATTLTVADGTVYYKNWQLEIDQEIFTVTSNGSGTSVPIRKAARGTTSASHASGSVVLVRPSFFAIEIIDKINAAKDDAYPFIYKPVLDTSLTTTATVYEYTVPNMPGTYGGDTIPIPYLSRIEGKRPGAYDFILSRDWQVKRAATPKIQFTREPEIGMNVRVHGFGPFPDLLLLADTLDPLWPKNADKFLPIGAASFLLASGESGRVRVDTLATDDREQANRVGSSSAQSQALLQRYRLMVANASMPPIPPHCKPTF